MRDMGTFIPRLLQVTGLILVAVVLLVLFNMQKDDIIGTIDDVTMETITIEGKVYHLNENTGLDMSDREKFQGMVVGEKDSYRVYSIRDDENGDYLYLKDMRDGYIYTTGNVSSGPQEK